MSRKGRDACAKFCGGRLAGIVENLKLRGELPEDFVCDFRPLRGLAWIPAGAYEFKCPMHGRVFLAVGKDGKAITT